MSSITARSGRAFLLAALGLAPLAAFAQTTPLQLAPVVVTATRTAANPQTVGTAVDVISGAELDRQQLTGVADALGQTSSAALARSGAVGATTSLFLRGANSNQTLFLVDGLRLNDPNTDYQVFLAGATLGSGDVLEIARGPQSTLYGGEAIGGVVALRAARGSGTPSGRVGVEGGSFGTYAANASSQGEHGASAYNVAVDASHTDNARSNNSLDALNVAARVDHTVSDRIAVGGTVRWLHSEFGSPGDRFTNDPNDTETESNLLATAFADVKPAPAWAVHAIVGGQDRRYVADTPAPNPPYGSPSAKTVITNRRAVLDAQTTFTGLDRHRLLAGMTAEATRTRNTGFGDINKRQGLFAVFAQDEFSPRDDVFLTAGVRNDDFDTFGHATTGRASAAWLVAARTVKLRASYGTGFRSPSFLDLYGRDAYYVGNPRLKPETSHGWDAGIDYYLPQQRGTLSATWFESRFSDLIDYNFNVFPSTVVNIGRARTRGVEFAADAALAAEAHVRVSYTYLEANNLTAGTRLLRRPRHQFAADVWHAFPHGVSAGAGVVFAADRQDVDAQSFATIRAEDYTVVRAYGRWQATPQFALKVRLENLLDEKYESVNGYPALGFGAFGGAEWKF